VPVDQLLRRFDGEEQAGRPLAYARSFVEYCSYIALRVETRRQDHLGYREFHSLTYDMMLAWEAPDEETDAMFQVRSIGSSSLDKKKPCKSHRVLTKIGFFIHDSENGFQYST
jgi:hypothetical protein